MIDAGILVDADVRQDKLLCHGVIFLTLRRMEIKMILLNVVG